MIITENFKSFISKVDDDYKRILSIVYSMDNVKDITSYNDWNVVGRGGYAVVLTNTKNDQYALRIGLQTDTEKWDQFVNHRYPNIVEVKFFKTQGDYSVVVTEVLEQIEQDKEDIISNIGVLSAQVFKIGTDSNLLARYDYKYTFYDIFRGIQNMVSQQVVQDLKPNTKRKIQQLIDNYEEHKEFLIDISEGFKQYYNHTSEHYHDFHFKNIMKDSEGTYKLIDL